MTEKAGRPLETYDGATQRINDDRGTVYGHPIENFSRIQALKAQVRDCKDPHVREALEMICVKVARLVESPAHVDSFIDIAGYARCGVMCLDRKDQADGPNDVAPTAGQIIGVGDKVRVKGIEGIWEVNDIILASGQVLLHRARGTTIQLVPVRVADIAKVTA